MVASFGPYLFRSAGLRIEHLVIYLSVPLFAASLATHARQIPLRHPAVVAMALLLTAFAWTFATTAFGGYAPASSNVRISSIENALQPILVSLIAFTAMHRRTAAEILATLDRVLILFMGIMLANTVIAAASVVIDVSPLMRYFTRTDDATWFAAITGARLSGLFSQPAEQGAAISMALLAWAYRYRTGKRGFWAGPLVLLVIVFGGIVGLSKIFIIGGSALFVLYLGPTRVLRLVLAPRNLLVMAAFGVAAVVLFPEAWRGMQLLQVWFRADSPLDLISSLSSGRFGSNADFFVQRAFAATWNTSPVFGFGYGYSALLDNGFLEFFMQGGMVSLALYAAILLFLAAYGFASRSTNTPLGLFLVAITGLIIGGNIGIPVISINRFSPCLWIIITTALSALYAQRLDKAEAK